MVWGMVDAFSRPSGLFDLSPTGSDLDVYPDRNHKMSELLKKVKALGTRARPNEPVPPKDLSFAPFLTDAERATETVAATDQNLALSLLRPVFTDRL